MAKTPSGRQVFLVGFDTEFVEVGGVREILSWQFTVADGTDQSVLHDFCFFPAVPGVRLTVFNVLWYVIGHARLYEHPMVYEAVSRNGLKVPNRYISPDEYDDLSSKSKIKICLLSHFGQADLTSFRVDFAGGSASFGASLHFDTALGPPGSQPAHDAGVDRARPFDLDYRQPRYPGWEWAYRAVPGSLDSSRRLSDLANHPLCPG